MRLKIDEHGSAAVVDGKPVYIYDDGKESPFDAPEAMNMLSHLVNCIEEDEAARKSLKQLSSVDQGKIEEMRAVALKFLILAVLVLWLAPAVFVALLWLMAYAVSRIVA